LGLEWVITLKENQPDLLAEAQRLTGGQAETTGSIPKRNFNSGTHRKSIGQWRIAPSASSRLSAAA
jgi:hypothetical protein